ncbi:hypothetical protein WJX72_010181 [[Myrmecia] bisecta]|uniref:Uncharacterized protein n=1 Tax=[Myrmecia] bisecta TaxID=41462 RepID=A0AAW1QSH6_9CHLO
MHRLRELHIVIADAGSMYGARLPVSQMPALQSLRIVGADERVMPHPVLLEAFLSTLSEALHLRSLEYGAETFLNIAVPSGCDISAAILDPVTTVSNPHLVNALVKVSLLDLAGTADFDDHDGIQIIDLSRIFRQCTRLHTIKLVHSDQFDDVWQLCGLADLPESVKVIKLFGDSLPCMCPMREDVKWIEYHPCHGEVDGVQIHLYP